MGKTIWSGRFSKPTARDMQEFSASLPFDRRLFDADIRVNRAWAKALRESGIYSDDEYRQVDRTLESLLSEHRDGTFPFDPSDEDIHSANERRLTEILGAVGARIHTGRSRNDQVVTDFKVYIRDHLDELSGHVQALQAALLTLAEQHVHTLLPGYTHVRQAQPISFAHYLLAFFFQLDRDRSKIIDWRTHHNRCPLGSGALAGSAFDIDRQALAADLGFAAASENSIDATSDRDFVIDCTGLCVQIMLHISRLAEDWIYWSSEAYGFLSVDQMYATGSSMMPQKMNPDSLELVRGKTARVIGMHSTLLNLLKGLPMAYARDLQEDKEPLFDTLHQTALAVRIVTGVVQTIHVHTEKMRQTLDPALYATDIADYLVRKGLPFRQAHEIVGRIVAYSEETGQSLDSLSADEFVQFHSCFDPDVLDLFDPQHSIALRNLFGGTGPVSVRQQIELAKQMLTLNSNVLLV
ncbi:argininosuccinate lyase [candidate division KSB1 bacterium]|nr:argininosuccinate lyase [candidate division KSB1 bacterium]